MKNKKLFFYLPAAILGIYGAIRYSAECSRGITQGINFCLSVLIPSLFLFMLLSSLIVRSRLALFLTKPLSGLSKALFKLPSVSLAAILLALIGGYPVGARAVSALYEKGMLSHSQAQKTAYVAVAAGPGFVVNYIGQALLNHKTTGILLLVSQTVSVILTGVIIGRTVSCDEMRHPENADIPENNLLIDAVTDASKGAFSMCAMVIVFCALTEVLSAVFSSFPEAVGLAAGLLEVTTGVNRAAGVYPLWLIAFYVGFGGLSVHFQIFASLGEIPVKKHLFFLYRIIQGIIASLLTYISVSIFPGTTAVFSTIETKASAEISGTLWGSAALVLLSLFFLGSIGQGGNYVRNRRNHHNRI